MKIRKLLKEFADKYCPQASEHIDNFLITKEPYSEENYLQSILSEFGGKFLKWEDDKMVIYTYFSEYEHYKENRDSGIIEIKLRGIAFRNFKGCNEWKQIKDDMYFFWRRNEPFFNNKTKEMLEHFRKYYKECSEDDFVIAWNKWKNYYEMEQSFYIDSVSDKVKRIKNGTETLKQINNNSPYVENIIQ